jgi:superfamily II DNA or RNA helicase
MVKRQRRDEIERLNSLSDQEPRLLLATGRLIGEGFDHARLDTLLLAMPISWKGTLQQYAGRLHRQHALKDSVQIYDYVDASHAQLARMWERRKRGYRAMGYVIVSAVDGQGSLPGFETGTARRSASRG